MKTALTTSLTTLLSSKPRIMRTVASTFLATLLVAGFSGLPKLADAKVKDKTKVTATWIAPTNGSILTAPATIVLSVDAEAKQANQPIVSVEFFNGVTLIGRRTSASSGLNYQLSWPNVSPGTYSLTATATNDKGDFDTTDPVTITVIKADQSINGFSPATPITYAPNASFTLTATGGASANPILFASATPATCSVSSSTVTIQSAGVCTITADQAGNVNYNPAPQVTSTVTINKANQAITGFNPTSPVTYSNGGSITLNASGGASGNAVIFASATPVTCTVSGSTATLQSAGICTLTADQAGNNNYNPAPQVMTTVTINKANQAITGFTPASPVTYSTGGIITLNASGGASGNPVIFASSTPAVCAMNGNGAMILSVGTCTLTADQAGNLNYNPAIQITAAIIINKADQIISGFNPATPIAYAIGGTFTLSATGGASGNAVTFASTTPMVCSVSGNVATIQAAGACALTADQTGNSNYNAAPQATASVTISKASQSITGFSPATPIAYTSGGTFTLTATGGASGNAIVYSTTTSTVCSVTGHVATILAVGTCTLTADQAGTANYDAANTVTVSVVINKTAQTITDFSPAGQVSLAVGGTFTLTATGGASGNPVTFTSSTANVCTTGGVNGATVTVVTAGTCMLTANQAGNATFNAASPVNATVLVTIHAAEGQIFYIHADHLGTPRAITRPSDNAIVWKWENSDPFGANAPNEDPSNTGTAFKYNLRFPGQYYDQETGTNYNYYRDFDPNTGRYVQSDPIGLKGGINTYAYVRGNPLVAVDPTGLVSWTGTMGSGGIIDGVGAALFVFDLTSECKCGVKMRIRGYVPTLAGGFGLKFTANSSPASFTDIWDCPKADIANGWAGAFSVTSIVVGGASWGSMRIGGLSTGLPSVTMPAYGLDISAGVFVGRGAVTSPVEITKCSDCEAK